MHNLNNTIEVADRDGWTMQIVEGLRFMHDNGHVHRDLKPLKYVCTSLRTICRIFSILLSNNRNMAKIGDFGTAREEVATMTMGIGTSIYMAPEVLDHSNYTTKCDVYSFGITLCEVYTRRRPYMGMSKEGLMAKIQNGLRPVIGDEVDGWMRKIIERYYKKRSL